jgi:hypothetical protein
VCVCGGGGGLHEEHTAATGNNLFLRLKTEENQENLCWAGRLQGFPDAYRLSARENTEAS